MIRPHRSRVLALVNFCKLIMFLEIIGCNRQKGWLSSTQHADVRITATEIIEEGILCSAFIATIVWIFREILLIPQVSDNIHGF